VKLPEIDKATGTRRLAPLSDTLEGRNILTRRASEGAGELTAAFARSPHWGVGSV
jgi:hypothetical protein